MRVVGVIAEYNPFHRGHARHLRAAREAAGADAVVAVMSGCFVQRGEAALLSPSARARMALSCGADAVVALPALWSLRDAEHFALGGVALLDGLGVDAIAFGAETAELPLLSHTAALLEAPDERLHAELCRGLNAGLPHPAAVSRAAEVVQPGLGALLSSPNNVLAVSYLRAMRRLGSSMTAHPIPRQGDYHATMLDGGMPSATAVRGAVLRGDWRGACRALPPEAAAILQQEALSGHIHRPDGLDQALLYRLRAMDTAAWHGLPGLSEGLEDRLRAAARCSATREALLEAAKARRYPRARLARLCAQALLGITQADLDAQPLPDAALLLGFRRDAEGLLARLSGGRLPLLTRAASYPDCRWMAIEALAYDLWALPCGMPSGMLFTQGLARDGS